LLSQNIFGYFFY